MSERESAEVVAIRRGLDFHGNQQAFEALEALTTRLREAEDRMMRRGVLLFGWHNDDHGGDFALCTDERCVAFRDTIAGL